MDTRKFSQGEYLSVREVKEGQNKFLVILSAGTEQTDDKGKARFQCLTEFNGQQRMWRPNSNTIQAMQKAYGYESLAWVGKPVDLTIGSYNGKECIIGVPRGKGPLGGV